MSSKEMSHKCQFGGWGRQNNILRLSAGAAALPVQDTQSPPPVSSGDEGSGRHVDYRSVTFATSKMETLALFPSHFLLTTHLFIKWHPVGETTNPKGLRIQFSLFRFYMKILFYDIFFF